MSSFKEQVNSDKNRLIQILYNLSQNHVYFNKQTELCCASIIKVHEEIFKAIQNKSLQGFTIHEFKYGLYCFRLNVNKNTNLYKYNVRKISISIPPDAMGNRIQDFEGCRFRKSLGLIEDMPSTIEILLMDKNNKGYYEHPECYDVLRFDSIPDLIEELNNLSVFNEK